MRLFIPDTAGLIYRNLILLLLIFSFARSAAQDYDAGADGETDELIEQTPPVMRSQETISTLREVPAQQISKYRKDRNFVYATDPRYWQKQAKNQKVPQPAPLSSLSGSTARMILFVFIAFIAIFVIYRLLVVNRLFEGPVAKRKNPAATGVPEMENEEELDARIRKAAASKEYRLAVRLQYLKTLKMLDDKQMIRLQARSTNSDYLNQLLKSRFFSQFQFLTRIYDYVWYGEFSLTDEQYELARERFTVFQTSLQY